MYIYLYIYMYMYMYTYVYVCICMHICITCTPYPQVLGFLPEGGLRASSSGEATARRIHGLCIYKGGTSTRVNPRVAVGA